MLADPSTFTVKRSPRRWWGLVAVVGGLALGPIDLWGQVHAPYPWAHLFNSPSVWAAAAFAYGRWVRDRPAAPAGATIVLVVGVEAYYLADVLVRDANRANLTSATAMVWLVAGIVAGIVFGVAGGWAAETSGWRAVLGRAALPAVLGAEAVRSIVRLTTEPTDERPDDLGTFALLLALLSISALVVLVRDIDRRTAVQVVATNAIAALAVGGVVSAVL
jgi:MFS family permease